MAQQPSRHPSLASQHAPSIRNQKPPLPHVSTLWQSTDVNRNTFDARKTLSSQRPSKQRSTPSSPALSSIDLRNTPNIHLLAMPDLGPGPGEFKPAKQHHRRNNSSDIHSPSSLHGGSIFELPTMPNESPNSSVRTSFLAELEDTSGLDYSPVPPMPTQLSPLAETSILFKTNKLTSRAILKVVDETIAGIEASNRELLARAESAEASAYRLHVSNAELRSRVEELSAHYRPKPKAAMRSRGTQTNAINIKYTPKDSPRSSIDHTTSIQPKVIDCSSLRSNTHDQSSSTDPLILQEQYTEVTEEESQPKPKSRRSIRSLKFLHRHHAEAFSLPLSDSFSATLTSKSATRASSDRPRTADGITSPSRSKISVPPVPELPIFLSLTSHSVKKHKRSLSRDDAKKLQTMQIPTEKNPTPSMSKTPLGEMSPSPVHGVVEIGMGGNEEEDEKGRVKPLKSQRSRVRFLLKESMIRELLEGEKGKGRREKKVKEREERGEKVGAERKMSGFWKRGKKDGEGVPPLPVPVPVAA